MLAEVELRWMGWLRSTIAPLKVILDNKSFDATLRYRKHSGVTSDVWSSADDCGETWDGGRSNDRGCETWDEDRCETWDEDRCEPAWREITGTFSMIHACNAAWIANDVRMAPGARCDDGLITIVLVRKVYI